MAEANHSLQQTPTAAQARAMGGAIITLALLRAKNAVKLQLQAQGIKLLCVSARDISLMAEHYLDQHRARLIHEAREIVDRWNAQGMFGPRGGFRARR